MLSRVDHWLQIAAGRSTASLEPTSCFAYAYAYATK
jgi:hypothetical protein